MQSEEQILSRGGSPVSTKVLDQSDYSVYWKECWTCNRIKPFSMFRRDSSYREGVRDQCNDCESAPVLSTEEHLYRQREINFNAASEQRWGKDQLDFMDDAPRMTGYLHHSEFLSKLRTITGPELFIRDGNFKGDLALYKVWNKFTYENKMFYSRFDTSGPTFQYICYLTMGYSPEFSVIEFDNRAVPIRENLRGWRTVLLKLIKARMVSETEVNEVFGKARGVGAIAYNRDLYRWRNRK